MYDITDVDSYQKMEAWVKELRLNLGADIPIIIVGNKMDLENNRQIQLSVAEDYAKNLGLDHFSASAKTGKNVSEIFRQITESKWIKKFS